MALEGHVFLPLLRHLPRPQRQEVADEHVEEFFPVALEAAFDGPQVVGVEAFLAVALVSLAEGIDEILAPDLLGLEAVRRGVVFEVPGERLEDEGDGGQALLAVVDHEGRPVGVEGIDGGDEHDGSEEVLAHALALASVEVVGLSCCPFCIARPTANKEREADMHRNGSKPAHGHCPPRLAKSMRLARDYRMLRLETLTDGTTTAPAGCAAGRPPVLFQPGQFGGDRR